MTLNFHARQIADSLLRAGIRIAPPDAAEWGRAMLGELQQVEGDWTALVWALGGASVLARRALLSIIFPGRDGQTLPSEGDLFAKEGQMRKAAMVAVGSCVVASLLFFLVPTFREAFQVSLSEWHDVFHVTPSFHFAADENSLNRVARRAEQDHDAAGLAFVATRCADASKCARYADEAVQIDPKLIWVYSVVAVNHSQLPEIEQWVPKLKQWDPQNALPYLITAESIDIDQVIREKAPHRVEDESPAWQNALAAAFQSGKLDIYSDQLKALDRNVMLRYGLDDPAQVMSPPLGLRIPSYADWDSSRYANMLLDSGRALEAQGDKKGALQKYWSVVRFGQMADSHLRFFKLRSLPNAYERLEALSRTEGNEAQAELYAYLSRKSEQEGMEYLGSLRRIYAGGVISHWDAGVVRVGGTMMIIFGGLVLFSALSIVARSRTLRLRQLRVSRFDAALGIGSATALLLSSAMLYVGYQPYSEILRAYLRDGDESQLQQLREFLANVQFPLGVRNFYQLQDFVFYFWFAVSALCGVSLLFVVLRYLKSRARAHATA